MQGVKTLTVEGLKGKLSELGLVTTGRKGELQQRLLEHFGLVAGESDSEYEDVASAGAAHAVNVGRSMFTLRDIEDSNFFLWY